MAYTIPPPPLGIKPRNLWLEDRLNNINAAIARFIEADSIIPSEWIEERNKLCNIKVITFLKFLTNTFCYSSPLIYSPISSEFR